jgi:3-hydroxyisobutyrate dehydrogenase-like beta-hydroxyacid dehydrogenase
MERVGFIGVGMMGGAIAERMLKNGVPVLVYDRSPDAVARLKAAGADVAASVREIVDQTEIVFACLPTVKICKDVAFGEGGVSGGSKVKIYIETSTLGGGAAIDIAEGLAKEGITMLDSPVVGGTVALEKGTLGVLAAGPKDAFERAKFALESFAGKLFYLGDKAGMGQAGKVVNNAVAYAALLATCEAVALGMRAGIDMETAVGIVNQGSGANFFSQLVFPNFILQGKFGGTGAIEIGQKDVKLFLEEAQRLGVETPMASHVSALQGRIVDAGEAGRDTLETFHFFSDLVGLPRQG